MNNLRILKCDPTKATECSQTLAKAIEAGSWVQLLPKTGKKGPIFQDLLPAGPGVIISSSGSTGEGHLCLQPCSHLTQSALATGLWLKELGLNPKHCQLFNPLPINHVSGLMPWWRSQIWGSQHTWIMPSLMRDPVELTKAHQSFLAKKSGPLLLSLVPTQLKRLLDHPAGISWLQSFDVVWVGGSALPKTLMDIARKEKIRLSPCYGATETAAMVAALPPNDFLAGQQGCGNPLPDVEIIIGENNVLKIKTPRLALAYLGNHQLKHLADDDGWWQSGDKAVLFHQDCQPTLEIIGRVDTAIHSGGETIFPEKLEARLLADAISIGLPIKTLLLLPIQDQEWGERLVALVRWGKERRHSPQYREVKTLQSLTKSWQPAERPVKWYSCAELKPNEVGKLERAKWEVWLKAKLAT